MKLSQLSIKKIKIPFKGSFKHSSAERSTTQSIWVEACSTTGLRGFGEGCPREYVTHESLDSAFVFFNKYKEDLIDEINSVDDLRGWVESHENAIDDNPAAWCAIELALLDLLAKDEKCSVEELLKVGSANGSFQYSAVLGDAPIKTFEKQVMQYISLGMRDFKVKISGDIESDAAKFEVLRKFLPEKLRVRIDANNLWSGDEDAIAFISSLSFPVFALEEPLKPNDFNGLLTICQETGIRIILDESFLKRNDFKNIVSSPDGWIINLRVSKMGGLLRSLAVIDIARAHQIKIIVGAQVGETSLLTRAALTAAVAAKDCLIAQEGAFGTLLLQNDIVEPPLMFGEKGLLAYEGDANYGFQLDLQPRDEYFESFKV